MHTWCFLGSVHTTTPGNFLEAKISEHPPTQLHLQGDFLDALADRVMRRYEGLARGRLLALPSGLLRPQGRTKPFYDRLFDASGNHQEEFVTVAGECLAQWAEESLGGARITYLGRPHNNDPALDIIAIYQDPETGPAMYVVQVRCTEANLQNSTNAAAIHFEKLENGQYDSELFNILELMQVHSGAPFGVDLADLACDRKYRITAIHGEIREALRLLTTYDQHVTGSVDRRNLWLLRVEWAEFWTELGRRVYGRLSA